MTASRSRTAFEPAIWPIRIDPTHVDQIVINLLTNARDAMGNEGTITIRTSNVTIDEEYVRRHPGAHAGEYVALEVADQGSGMDDVTRERLFEPFFTTKTQQFGTGLGLSTVLGIVERSGGHIDVHSVVGEGTTFTNLPSTRPGAGGSAGNRALGACGARGRDRARRRRQPDGAGTGEADARVAQLPRALGGCRRGCSAHRTRRGREDDLVLVDTEMPQMTGKTLVERLREDHPDVKALYSCGYRANLVTHQEGLNADAYIQKPFTPGALAERIRGILHPTFRLTNC